ncbi:DUF4157 domain-containing protein [Mucilaginibacter sp. OK098]|uniref:eCIS core domain-containing protein n=1 Tax=Mucilaginibacter sp. OK098 TaxID=1855297 RepID=UPI0009224413|nr:DUF4157 domain-containing protein [Mucilaginibacter sp. OK098]SHN32821.1 protein of unknown function [Mucilaginibacter sp. OK098]
MPALKQSDTPNSAQKLYCAVASEMTAGNLRNDSIKAVGSVPGMAIQHKPAVQKKPGEGEELPVQRKFFNAGVSTPLQAFQPIQKKEQTFDTNTASGTSNKVPFIQAKLTINAPGDQYEQEADAMADKVMRMPANGLPFSPSSSSIPPIQRKCSDCENDEKVHRKETSSQPVEAGNDVSSYVSSLSSKGSPMPGDAKSFFEQRFGRDFSDVKIHDDGVAAKSAQSINALAYTHGNNIVFNQNQFSPETDSGKRLLAHELTHVVQQNVSLNKVVQKAPDERTELQTQYNITIEKGDKDWTDGEIKILKSALGRLVGKEKDVVRNYKFIRWTSQESRRKHDLDYKEPKVEECGFHEPDMINGVYKISMYDKCFADPEAVNSSLSGIDKGEFELLHEIGHALEIAEYRTAYENQIATNKAYMYAIEKKFPSGEEQEKHKKEIAKLDAADKAARKVFDMAKDRVINEFVTLVKDKPRIIPSITDPPLPRNFKEEFAEAFAIFKADPDFKNGKYADVYTWMSKTGYLTKIMAAVKQKK